MYNYKSLLLCKHKRLLICMDMVRVSYLEAQDAAKKIICPEIFVNYKKLCVKPVLIKNIKLLALLAMVAR